MGTYRGLDVNVTRPRIRRAHHRAAAEQLLRVCRHDRRRTAGPLPLRRQGEDPRHDVRAAPVRQGGGGVPHGRQGDGARGVHGTAISAHIDFVNARNLDDNQARDADHARRRRRRSWPSPTIVPATAAGLTLTQIMSQKYIAQWAWGHNELWMDMRRYHYTDIDPATAQQVYPGFTPPTTLYPDNGGKVVQRIRPRYNSEYVWNIPGLTAIGALTLDYHTKPLWITQP